MTLLSVVALFNLSSIFIRFLPAAGRLSTYFVRRGYLLVTAVALCLGALTIASGAVSSFVPPGIFSHVVFIIAVALFAIFALQDSVLTALRITYWVPIENASFAVFKLALLAALVPSYRRKRRSCTPGCFRSASLSSSSTRSCSRVRCRGRRASREARCQSAGGSRRSSPPNTSTRSPRLQSPRCFH